MRKLGVQAQNRIQDLLTRKKKGDDQIVIKLLLIGVAVVLGLLFQEQISTFITLAMTEFTTKFSSILA